MLINVVEKLMKQYASWICLGLMLTGAIGLTGRPLFAQSSPTPEPVRSLFENDTCAPPCFFGILPGKSRSSNIVALMETSSNIYSAGTTKDSTFELSTNYVIDGSYYFKLQSPDEFEDPDGVAVYVSDQLAYQINVYTDHSNFSIEEVIDALGPPDQVRVSQTIIGIRLSLIYVDLSLRLFFEPEEICRLAMINEDYRLSGMVFYAPEAVYPEGEDIFPRVLLTYLGNRSEFDVPLEMFGNWLAGTSTGSCYDGWVKLIAVSATQTAVPLLTLTPYSES
jgi:hypothetical protein